MRKAIILTLLLVLACAGPLLRRGGISDGPVAFQTILAGSHSLADTSYVELITDDREWENVWIVAKGSIDPLPSLPTVDFSRQNVIAAFMGSRPSSGYKIEISSIEKEGRVLTVHVKKYETPGMLTVVTSPFSLVRIPKGSYKLEIAEEIVE